MRPRRRLSTDFIRSTSVLWVEMREMTLPQLQLHARQCSEISVHHYYRSVLGGAQHGGSRCKGHIQKETEP